MLAMAPLGAQTADLIVWWQKGAYAQEDAALREIITAFEQESGKEVEYYRYDRLQAQVKLDDADFDPDQLWGKPTARAARK